MKRMGAGLLSVMCICAAADTLSAQETINYGTISGRVADPQGAVVPGASVIARQSETNQSRETVTDRDGRFRFPYCGWVITTSRSACRAFPRRCVQCT